MDSEDFLLDNYDYDLPQEMIAQVPAQPAESAKLLVRSQNDNSMQGIGYREFFPYLRGERSLDETVEQIKKDTRHFAKRQLTWFRREKDVIWMNKEDYPEEDRLLACMLSRIRA